MAGNIAVSLPYSRPVFFKNYYNSNADLLTENRTIIYIWL